jgi:hypothetical protein
VGLGNRVVSSGRGQSIKQTRAAPCVLERPSNTKSIKRSGHRQRQAHESLDVALPLMVSFLCSLAKCLEPKAPSIESPESKGMA